MLRWRGYWSDGGSAGGSLSLGLLGLRGDALRADPVVGSGSSQSSHHNLLMTLSV